MPLNNIEQEVMKEFDDEVDRLVARSLRDPSCKPLTELKSFLSTALSKAYEEGKREIVEKIKEFNVTYGVHGEPLTNPLMKLEDIKRFIIEYLKNK